MTETTMLKPKELAARWKITEQCLKTWRWKQIGPPYVKIGTQKCSRILYKLTDIEKFEMTNSWIN